MYLVYKDSTSRVRKQVFRLFFGQLYWISCIAFVWSLRVMPSTMPCALRRRQVPERRYTGISGRILLWHFAGPSRQILRAVYWWWLADLPKWRTKWRILLRRLLPMPKPAGGSVPGGYAWRGGWIRCLLFPVFARRRIASGVYHLFPS